MQAPLTLEQLNSRSVMNIRTDCRQYRNSAPCNPHKRSLVSCGRCDEYEPIDERIVIVKLDAMGDVLRTTACLPALKQLHPHSHVTWITRANAAPLLAGNPWIDRVLTIETNYLELVLSEDFELALGPDADLLSASIMSLVRCGTKRGFVSDRRGGVIPMNDAAAAWWQMGLNDVAKRENRRTYGEWLYAICELPGPVARPFVQPTPAALEDAARLLRAGRPAATNWICFNTGSSPRWQEKRWRAEHYLDLAAMIRQAAPGTAVALVGGPQEVEFNAGLLRSDDSFVDAGTSNSLDAFAAVVASCQWMVTPDSLGYHVACAVRTPALCVVGPTSPWELDLYGTNQVVYPDLDCIACYLSRCPLTTTCMDRLTPAAIWGNPGPGAAFQPCPGVAPVAIQRRGASSSVQSPRAAPALALRPHTNEAGDIGAMASNAAH